MGEAASTRCVQTAAAAPADPGSTATGSDQGAPRLLPPFVPHSDETEPPPAGDSVPQVLDEAVLPAASADTAAEPGKTSTAVAQAGLETALVTHANIDGPETAERTWQDGRGGNWARDM